MRLSVKTRFEVFKRDRFTCAYCGRTPPDVLLEADHIVPRAAGGSDDVTNLTTACQDCNRGKGARLLDEGTMPIVPMASIEEMQERLEQAKAYMELIAGVQAVTKDQVSMVIERWAKGFHATLDEQDGGTFWVLPVGQFPREASIRQILRRLPLHDVLDAVDITVDWAATPSSRACRYFYGICWRRIREAEGRE